MLAYQVIARKWRPQTFAELIGQDHVTQTLLNALRHNRLHHAILLTGPRGTGKTSSARILAKAVRCPNAVDFVPCGVCKDCEDIAASHALDVIEIDGASNNGVESVRELIDRVGYMPSSGTRKVYIIDEVHMLSTSAFNALLKTLEEPPEHVLFIMATTEVHKIPNTILSRCQRFDFRRIRTALVTEQLETICRAEGVTAEREALWLIARQGEGSMRDSLSLLDQVITFADGALTLDQTLKVLGLTDRRLLVDTVDCLVRRDVQAALTLCEKIFTAGYDAKIFVQELLECLRNVLMLKLSQNETSSGLIDLPESEISALREATKDLSHEDVHLLFDMALKGAQDLVRAPDSKIVLEMLLLRMSEAPRVQALSQFFARGQQRPEPGAQKPEARTQRPAPAPVPASAPAAAPVRAATPPSAQVSDLTDSYHEGPPPSAPKVTTKAAAEPAPTPPRAPVPPDAALPLAEKWKDLVHKIKAVNSVVGAKLENSFLKSQSGQSLVVGVPPKLKFLLDQVQEAEFQRKVQNYLTTFWGPGHTVQFEKGDEAAQDSTATTSTTTPRATHIHATPKVLEEQRVQKEKSDIRAQVENHPFVKSAQSVFKSEIKSIEEIKS